uniref:Ras association (RalGDS/AF-6) and pleckstrin homology domains 1 n=1 Tax=Tetraodon nigroviridis TaxID=99883 RepID=H3C013_TETNG
QDLDKMFGAWLGELDKLTQSLDDGRPGPPPAQQKAPLRQETNMANFSYRFSVYNINEALNQGENVDLDALMADLSSIEQELSTINKEISLSLPLPPPSSLPVLIRSGRAVTASTSTRIPQQTLKFEGLKEEQAAKLKADNIRVALEKIKEAQVKKLVIRVHLSDESSKTMMVDERQTVRQVLDSLLEKSHSGYSPDWSLVETISELQMAERIFEDHENLVENLLNWTRDSQNRLMFTERIEKYAVFKNPQNYLLGRKETCEMTERNKEALLEECFGGSSVSVPEMEGLLWLKEDGKKSWKKRYFLLRASGIYYVPKGKASRDLVCFLQLDHVNVYLGQDYKSKYKAPTDYCMVLKHPQIQKKSQYIKYLCCDDIRTLQQWINSIRIAKYGKQLYINFQDAMRKTEAAYDWSSLSSSSIKSGSSSSSLPATHSALPPSPPPPPSEPAPDFMSNSSSTLPPPPPPLEEDMRESYLPPPPPDTLEINGLPLPPPPEPNPTSCPQLSNAGLQQFLAKKFPNMAYDFAPPAGEDACPPPPPLSDASPPTSWPSSHHAPPPAPPKTFSGAWPCLPPPRPPPSPQLPRPWSSRLSTSSRVTPPPAPCPPPPPRPRSSLRPPRTALRRTSPRRPRPRPPPRRAPPSRGPPPAHPQVPPSGGPPPRRRGPP